MNCCYGSFNDVSSKELKTCKGFIEMMEVVMKAKEELPEMDLRIAGFRIIKHEDIFVVLSPDDVLDSDDDDDE